jgi:predicted kinase
MMIGVAGSGKSTVAAEIAKESGAEIVSSDAIRGEIYGDENCQANPARVFEIVHQRVQRALREGRDVIMDATNLSCKRRMAFLKTLKGIPCKKTCVVVIATPEDIEERMKHRERKVPMEVVHKQMCQFQCPNYYEGWHKIEVRCTSAGPDAFDSYMKLLQETRIPHDNHHHTLDIHDHMLAASEYMKRNPKAKDDDDEWVAYIHDWGKPRVKTFTNAKGEKTEEAHYYGHQNYGAYYSLLFDSCFLTPTFLDLDNACLVQWHMEHYIRHGQTLEKFYEMIGPELTRRLKLLEEADKAAH